ncbi:MAG: DUF4199 domain-containing protein [Bacteroidia bacterium]
MKKTVLIFGTISGLISVVMLGVTLMFSKSIGFDKGMIIGYATIILSLSLIFFGIKSYRDNIQQGSITFGKAFGVGILICLISCLFYVITWEIMYFNFMPDFTTEYANYQMEQLKAGGASEQVMQAALEESKKFKEMYDNPLINAAITFTEPFPVGLIITLISALILKKKQQVQTI